MKDRRTDRNLTTSQLLSVIKKSNSFLEVAETLQNTEGAPAYCHYLYQLMETYRFSAKEMIVDTGIERSYFYHILSGRKIPGRNMSLRIGLCLGATLSEVNQLLRLSNQGSLYPRVRRDAAIIFAIDNKYTMQQTNDFLNSLQEAPLYQEEST